MNNIFPTDVSRYRFPATALEFADEFGAGLAKRNDDHDAYKRSNEAVLDCSRAAIVFQEFDK